jgi:hypothetical protein
MITIIVLLLINQSRKLLLVLASTIVLGIGPRRERWSYFFLSRLVRVLKWGLLFNERRVLTTPSHPLSTGVVNKNHFLRCHSVLWSAYHTIITSACSAKAIYEYVRRFVFLADIANRLRGFHCIRSP